MYALPFVSTTQNHLYTVEIVQYTPKNAKIGHALLFGIASMMIGGTKVVSTSAGHVVSEAKGT
jgi:hypothetical protein